VLYEYKTKITVGLILLLLQISVFNVTRNFTSRLLIQEYLTQQWTRCMFWLQL